MLIYNIDKKRNYTCKDDKSEPPPIAALAFLNHNTYENKKNRGGGFTVSLTSKLSDSDECERVTVYGVEIKVNNLFYSAYPDISSDISTVNSLLSILTQHNISTIHIHDIIEDFII